MRGAGKYRHRIQIQAFTQAEDAAGEVKKSWKTVWSRWAEVLDQGGGEANVGQQVKAEASVQVTLRHEPRLTTRHRILFGSRILDINAIANPDGRKIEMVCLCREAKA